MKRVLLIIAILIQASHFLAAQADSVPSVYRAWILFNNQSEKFKGLLYDIKDSSLILTNSYSHSDYQSGSYETTVIDYRDIFIIKVRKNKNVLYGFLGGLSIGFLTGAIIGGIQGDDICPTGHWCLFQMTAGEKAMVGGILGGLSGSIIGTLVGGIKINIPINGRADAFDSARRRLKSYSYLH